MNNLISHCLVLVAACVILKQDCAAVHVKEGEAPYMVYLYYLGEQIKDSNGMQFFLGGVLVNAQHVLSTCVEPAGGASGFPHATLVARAGAAVISRDSQLGSGEQQREVVRVMRPHNPSMHAWRLSEVNVLRTAAPFAISAAVAPARLRTALFNLTDEPCHIVVFVVPVKLLDQSQCSESSQADRMLCYAERDKDKNSKEICQGNAGSPLLCKGAVIALQSYGLDKKCKFPRMSQRLSFWKKMLNCSIENECSSDDCKFVCTVTNKNVKKDNMTKKITPIQGERTKAIEHTHANTYDIKHNVKENGSIDKTNYGNIANRRAVSPTKNQKSYDNRSISSKNIKFNQIPTWQKTRRDSSDSPPAATTPAANNAPNDTSPDKLTTQAEIVSHLYDYLSLILI